MEKLIAEAKKGNEEAFIKLIHQIEDSIYKIAKIRLNQEEDIEDAVQETIIEAFYSIKKLRNDCYFKTWIIKILINKCNKIYQKRSRSKLISIEENNVENYIQAKNEKEDIEFYILIKDLNYEERIILTLYYAEEYTTKEIAEILNKNENTIKSKILRAKNKLKKNLESKGEI